MDPFLSNIPVIETENYLLRGMTLEDTSSLFVFMCDRETMFYITRNPMQTVEEIEQSILSSLNNYEKSKEIPWVVLIKQQTMSSECSDFIS